MKSSDVAGPAQLPALRGPVAMLVTTFDSAEEVDLSSMAAQAQYALTKDAAGVALFGLAGEGAKLNASEREAIVRTVAAVVPAQAALVVAADHGGTRIAASLAARFALAGATHIMAMPPAAATATSLLQSHFAALADASGLPVILQDAPAASHVSLSVNAILELATTVSGLQGIKVEAPPCAAKLAALRGELSDSVALYGGRGGVGFFAELHAGADGTMVGPATVGGFARAWSLWQQGRIDDTRRLMSDVAQLAALAEGNDLYSQMQKVLLHSFGVISSPTMRAPSAAAPTWLRDEWRATAATITEVGQ